MKTRNLKLRNSQMAVVAIAALFFSGCATDADFSLFRGNDVIELNKDLDRPAAISFGNADSNGPDINSFPSHLYSSDFPDTPILGLVCEMLSDDNPDNTYRVEGRLTYKFVINNAFEGVLDGVATEVHIDRITIIARNHQFSVEDALYLSGQNFDASTTLAAPNYLILRYSPKITAGQETAFYIVLDEPEEFDVFADVSGIELDNPEAVGWNTSIQNTGDCYFAN